MPEKIRIGIVGCGRILPAYLRAFAELRKAGVDNFVITALCARKLGDALMFRKRGEGPPPRPPVGSDPGDPLSTPHSYVSDFQPEFLPHPYDDYRAMLRSGNVDGVLDLTPLFMHHQVCLAALEAGKHVLVEKPIAITVRAARRLVDLAAQKQRVLGVAEVVRYGEGGRANAWVIRNGLIGQLQMYVHGIAGLWGWSPDRIVAKTPWRHQKLLAGAGPAVDMGVHFFHNVRYQCGEVAEVWGRTATFEPVRRSLDATGQEVERVQNEVEDTFFCTFTLENGAQGVMFASWAGHGEPTHVEGTPVIYESKGCIKGGKLIQDGKEPRSVRQAFAEGASAQEKERCFPFGLKDGFALEFLDFLRAIERSKAMEVTGEEGLRDLATAYAVVESAALNRPVAVADVLAGQVETYQAPLNQHYGL
jgi:predicted dehydrogenase